LIPQPLHIVVSLVVMLHDVVKDDHSPSRNQRAVHLEIFVDAFVGMVAVDEE